MSDMVTLGNSAGRGFRSTLLSSWRESVGQVLSELLYRKRFDVPLVLVTISKEDLVCWE